MENATCINEIGFTEFFRISLRQRNERFSYVIEYKCRDELIGCTAAM